jgi:hypothetical protein
LNVVRADYTEKGNAAASRRAAAQLGVQLLHRVTSRLSMYFMPSTAASAPAMVVKVVTRASSDEVRICARVGDGVAALFHRVDHHHDLVVLDHVDHVRPALGDLVHHGQAMPAAGWPPPCPWWRPARTHAGQLRAPLRRHAACRCS